MLCTLGIVLYCFFAYETLEDLTENISVFMTQTSLCGRFFVLAMYRKELLVLIRTVANNFYAPGPEEKAMVQRTIAICQKLGKSIFILYVFTTLAMISHPLTADERVLPFKSWYPMMNSSVSPFYELQYMAQASLTIMEGWFAGAMDSFVISMLLYGALQFELVAHGIRKSKSVEELRTCIQYHQAALQYGEDMCTALNPVFTVQVFSDNLLICVLGFQVMVMETDGIKIIRVLLHLVCAIFQIWFLCAFCSHFTTQSSSVYEAAYESTWYDQKPAFKQMIWMVVERARKPVALSAGLFGEMSLPLFSAIMRSSYSYMALLSQMNEENFN
uniref:Chemosensory protein n=1 Tax=Blattella germanica TaxID=6973 RepID=A0A109QFT2_BLAGE|nr:chemosensory protein [Blattella germanica]